MFDILLLDYGVQLTGSDSRITLKGEYVKLLVLIACYRFFA